METLEAVVLNHGVSFMLRKSKGKMVRGQDLCLSSLEWNIFAFIYLN